MGAKLHITSRLGATGVQKGRFGRPKIEFSSKVAKLAGKIGIDLMLIFCTLFVNFVVYKGVAKLKYFLFIGLSCTTGASFPIWSVQTIYSNQFNSWLVDIQIEISTIIRHIAARGTTSLSIMRNLLSTPWNPSNITAVWYRRI